MSQGSDRDAINRFWDERPGHQDHPLSRRAFRDLWYHVARLRAAKGDYEGAARARRNARGLDSGVFVVTPRPKRPNEMRRDGRATAL